MVWQANTDLGIIHCGLFFYVVFNDNDWLKHGVSCSIICGMTSWKGMSATYLHTALQCLFVIEDRSFHSMNRDSTLNLNTFMN